METEKRKLKIFDPEDIRETGKGTAETGPHTDVTVLPSPMGQLTTPGYKCEHGVYIPYTSHDPNRAPYCSLCYPYLIQEKTDGKQS